MQIINKKNYDTTFKINNRSIKCYSKDKMKDLYPNGNYVIVGETFQNNKNEEIDKIVIADKELVVSEYKKNSPIMYKREYFIAVGENKYICLLKSRLFILLLFLLIIGITLSFGSLLFIYFRTPMLSPEYSLPPEDKNSTEIEEDHSKRLESGKGGGSVRIRLSNIANVKLSTDTITMAYQNPNQSNQNSVISLVVIKNGNEYYIARSGIVKAGKQITELQLNTSQIKLTEGVYKGKYIIDHYNPESGEKALTNSVFNDIEIRVSR